MLLLQAGLQASSRPTRELPLPLTGADFPECCAYLLQLRAWKRTTNGYSNPQWVHANEFELAFTVPRPELCPDICVDKREE